MTRLLQTLGITVASLASTVYSQVNFNPISNGPSYSIGIPSNSQVSTTSTGSIYLQLSAPSSYQWVGFGIGEQMAGAKIFVMYADGNGNVTISARDGGQGHVQPLLDEGLQSGVTLLAGSGIVGDQMIANIKCEKSTLASAKDDSASPFIAAWMSGSPLDSTSPSASIRQHSGNAYRQFTFDLSNAVITGDSNPFLSGSSTNTSSGTGGSSSGDDNHQSDDDDKGGSNSNGSGSGSSSGGATVVGTSGDTLAKYQKAHGIVMGVTIVLLFPLGAIFMRLGGSAIAHGALQILSLCALIAGFGLGVKLGDLTDLLYNTTHTIFGTVIFALFLLQPLLGITHHLQYRKSGTRNPVSHLHIWYGRIIMILGIVNGGLGLQLAKNTKGGEIAYGVVAGVVGLGYVVLVVVKRKGVTSVDGQGPKRRWGRREKHRDTSS